MKERTGFRAARAAVVVIYAALILPFVHSYIRKSYQTYLNIQYWLLPTRVGQFGRVVEAFDRYLVVNYVLLLFLPLLILLLLFRHKVADYGFDLGDARAGRRLFVFFFVPTFVGLAVASHFDVFQSYYPIYEGARYQWRELVYWEIAYNGFYMFCWEFFFRGFLLFSLRPVLGNWAILAQALAFGAMHWGKPMPEFYASFATGIVLGFVALRCRSFLPTWALHTASAVSFDLLVLAWGGRL